MDDIDKHRLTAPTITNLTEGAFKVEGGFIADPGEKWGLFANTANLEDGAELFVFECERSRPELKYQFNARLRIGMRHERGPKGADRTQVNELLTLLRDEVTFVVTSVFAATK